MYRTCIDVNLNIKIRLLLVYRKPKQNIQLDEDLYETLISLIVNKVSIIIGDFNSPSIGWESLSSNNEDSQLLTFYNDNFLTQFVHEPTREHNILDLILVSEKNIVTDVVIDSPLSTSDNNMVQFKINIEGNIKWQVPSRLNYKLARWNVLKERLANHLVNINKDWNEYWNNFKDNLLISQE